MEAGAAGDRGAFVAFGNTRPRAREKVQGRLARGEPGKAFNPRDGSGRAEALPGDYPRAAARGVEVKALLVETYGGLEGDLVELFQAAAAARGDTLSAGEYDETTWSARTWLVFVEQRISVAVQRSIGKEIAQALGLATAGDPRDEA